MGSVARRLSLFGLIVVLCLVWRARTDRDVAVAQARSPIMVTRIFTGPDGLSHAEQIELPSTNGNTEMFGATGIQFSSRAPSPSSSDWHTGPKRQYVITLAGRGELEVANGVKIPLGPGQIDLIEDTTGKGHITRNFGPDNRLVVTIPLADQAGAGAR